MFEKVEQRVSFPDLEKQLMARWKEEETFQRSLDLRQGQKRFVFYEGPPTANGKPATHHILARAFKDLFGRYKTMKGFYVERKAGWDTHGLPVEIEVEKKLNISGKFEIENEIGVEKFNELCRQSVHEYVENDIVYIKVREGDEYLILAEALLTVLKEPPEVVERITGRDLVGLEYEPLYPYSVPDQGRAHYVVDADFVSTEEGTGVVHTSALYGVDDLRLCQEKGIPFKHTVGLDGKFLPYVEKFAGLHVKEADPVIIDDLKERGLLYKAETILHTYPFCWRCGTPLIYYALDAWYIRTTERKEQLLANNNATYWVPDHIRTGRMGDWLENNVDWQFSRSRYWGTPVPIWICEGCDEKRIVTSAAELGLDDKAELHRPYIDAVTLKCEKCGAVMRRVPEVMDTWFDSGSMPFAQRGYPRHGKEGVEETFPADFISEAVDQTRGWFYTLLAISTLLFKQNSYRNVICLGHVVDPKGKKASKSRGNVLDPNYLFDNFGSDAVRWYFYTSTQIGENYRTGDAALKETVQQFFIPLWNCYSFFVTYARLDNFDPAQPQVPVRERPGLHPALRSKLSGLVASVAGGLDAYEPVEPARRIHRFVDDLSNWYIRRSRRRFWKSQSDRDKAAAYQTLYQALRTVSELMAPFAPFVSDAMYRNLSEGKSVHLADFPVPVAPEDPQVEADMARARQGVEAGLAARDAARLKVRQPLASIALPGDPMPEEIAAIVRG